MLLTGYYKINGKYNLVANTEEGGSVPWLAEIYSRPGECIIDQGYMKIIFSVYECIPSISLIT